MNEPLLLTLVKAAQEAETKLLSSPSPARASNAALVAEARAKFNFYDEVRILVIYIYVCDEMEISSGRENYKILPSLVCIKCRKDALALGGGG